MGRKVSFAEYARHRGVSNPAVTYAVRDGRIPVETDPATGRRVIDVELADSEWDANTRADMRDRAAGLSAQEARDQASADPSALEGPKPSPRRTIVQAPADPELEGEDSDDVPPGATVRDSRALHESYKAKIAKLDYEERIGKVVDADQVRERWSSVASIIRSKVLGLAPKLKQRCPDLTMEHFAELERISREALEDLSED